MPDMNRRALLKRLGVTAGIAATAGCEFLDPGSPGNTTSNGTAGPGAVPGTYENRFDTILDITEQGADASGEESVVGEFEDSLASDTLLYLPPGEYMMDDTVQFLEFDNVGIVGDNATIRPADGFDSVLFDIGRGDTGSNFLVENIEFDVRAEDTGPRPMSLLLGGESTVRDLSVIGEQDAGWSGFRIDTTDPEGVTTVDRLDLQDGSIPEVGSPGCYVGDRHVGEVQFNDCHIDGFSDNGLYADTPNGAVRVNGGYFANCDVASLRVGSDSRVDGAHIRCDTAPEGFDNMRGLRLREGSYILVENTTIEMRDVNYSDGAIVFAHWLQSATIQNTHIQIETNDIPAVRIRDPNGEGEGGDPIEFENVTIDGPAGGGPTIEVDERDGCAFNNLWVFQSGENRDGFLFDGTTATLENTYISVTGEAVRSVEGSNVQQSNLDIQQGGGGSDPSPPDVTDGTPTGVSE